jgi:hypothetical protein
MAWSINEGSDLDIAADVHGTAHNISPGEHTQFVALASGTLGDLAFAVEANPAFVAAELVGTPSANFTRPNDTTQYAANDLVADNTTAGSVTPLSWTAPRYATGSGQIRRARLKKSGTTVTAASFRLHLYTTSPTCANGDNGAWSTSQAGYLGSIDLDMSGANGRVFTDAAEVVAGVSHGTEIGFDLASGSTIYGLLQAIGTYTPVAQEVFTCELEIVRK